MIAVPIAAALLAIFGLGCMLVRWAVDRDFPMTNAPRAEGADLDDEPDVDELDIADEVALADTGRRWAPKPRKGGAAA